MTTPQEIANAIVNVIIDGCIREHGGPVTEIVGPTSQNHIEAVAHFRPGCQMATIQTIGHFLPQPSDTLFDGLPLNTKTPSLVPV